MSGSVVEKRKFGRRAAFKPAVIIQGDGERISGFVVDISEGGARFRTPDVARIKKVLTLEIPGDDFVVQCEVVHYLDDAVGVRYVGSPKRLSWQQSAERKRRHVRNRAGSAEKSMETAMAEPEIKSED